MNGVPPSDQPTGPAPQPGEPGGYIEQAGQMIGPYKLLQVIGEGGFGIVWLAERRQPMVQRVALKIIKPGMDSKAVIARFEQERQALAVMDHPNVAKVFDGGIAPSGRPYFVMEHVAGEPITVYCDRHNLTIRDRLHLFTAVCEAVQHAHHKGLIHRDLKPSNILVTVKDAKAIPKVIDFGVAKAISHTLTDQTIFTETGQLIGTPEYMSPEQAEMGATDIDTRTDVYSLGIVLYELLSGVLPFTTEELRSRGLAAIHEVIRHSEPARPSTRLLSADPQTGTAIAAHRADSLSTITAALRRELDWIPLKAMRKDRTRRYETPLELLRDIHNYLNGLPVDARPDSVAYRARKFIQRNKWPFAVAVVVAALTLAGVYSTLWQARIASNERDLARSALADSRLAYAFSTPVNSVETPKLLLEVLVAREDLGTAFGGQAILAEWMLGEFSRDSGMIGESLTRYDATLRRLQSTLSQFPSEDIAEESVLREINAVLPGLDDAESLEDIRTAIERGRIAALLANNRYGDAASVAEEQLKRLALSARHPILHLHAARDVALLQARAGLHAEAVSSWDTFEKQLAEYKGKNLSFATGMCRSYSVGVSKHGHDLYFLALDLNNSLIEAGRWDDAERQLLMFESNWRGDQNDDVPESEMKLQKTGYRLLTGLTYRVKREYSAWNGNPLPLLVKLYEQKGLPAEAALWRTREEKVRQTGKPPVRWY